MRPKEVDTGSRGGYKRFRSLTPHTTKPNMKTKVQILKAGFCILAFAVFATGCAYESPSEAKQDSKPVAARPA